MAEIGQQKQAKGLRFQGWGPPLEWPDNCQQSAEINIDCSHQVVIVKKNIRSRRVYRIMKL